MFISDYDKLFQLFDTFPTFNQTNKAVATGTVPYPLLETLQVRHRIFSRKSLAYGTVSVALYTTGTEPYLRQSKQQYGTVSHSGCAGNTVPYL